MRIRERAVGGKRPTALDGKRGREPCLGGGAGRIAKAGNVNPATGSLPARIGDVEEDARVFVGGAVPRVRRR